MKIAISPKRSQRSSVPKDWIERVQNTQGVSDLVQSSFGRITVEASDEAVQTLKTRLGESFHVEKIVIYNKQD